MRTVFKLANKVAAFKVKLELWGLRVNRGIFHMFQTLTGILTEAESSFSQLMHNHLSLLLKECVNKPGESSLSVPEQDQLLEIANEGGLKNIFHTSTLPVFWIRIKAEYPKIAKKALKTLLLFPTSYLSEAGFLH